MTRNFSQMNFLKKSILLFLLLGAFSCSSQSTDSDTAPGLPSSEADLLDSSEQATEVSDSSIFSDLNPTNEPSSGLIDNSDSLESGSDYVEGDSPFYSPIGGEKLGRVAYTLYGNREKVSLLEEKNPGFTKDQTLNAGDKVYFEFAGLNPQVRFLTKDLIERYPAQLAESIQSGNNGLSQTTVTVDVGETLQMISQRLYGTTRYWTEIYLLNHKELKSYDMVRPGTSLTVYQRDTQLANASGMMTTTDAGSGGESPLSNTEVSNQLDSESNTAMDTSASPKMEQSVQEQQPVDPIPDMSSNTHANEQATTNAEATQPPPEYVPQPLATADSADEEGGGFLSNTTNLRRVIFVALIVIIGLIAFFMTGSKRKKKFDMLDVTSADTAERPKYQKNSNNKDVG